jgi:hypothetical protein
VSLGTSNGTGLPVCDCHDVCCPALLYSLAQTAQYRRYQLGRNARSAGQKATESTPADTAPHSPELKVARVAVQLELEKAAPVGLVARRLTEHTQDTVVARRGAASEVDDRLFRPDLQHELRLLDGVEGLDVEVPVGPRAIARVVPLARDTGSHSFFPSGFASQAPLGTTADVHWRFAADSWHRPGPTRSTPNSVVLPASICPSRSIMKVAPPSVTVPRATILALVGPWVCVVPSALVWTTVAMTGFGPRGGGRRLSSAPARPGPARQPAAPAQPAGRPPSPVVPAAAPIPRRRHLRQRSGTPRRAAVLSCARPGHDLSGAHAHACHPSRAGSLSRPDVRRVRHSTAEYRCSASG